MDDGAVRTLPRGRKHRCASALGQAAHGFEPRIYNRNALHYREIAPGEPLRPHVRCLWLLTGPQSDPDADVERVVPDGCAEIVLNRADRFRRLQDGSSHAQAEVLLVGQIRRSISIAPTGVIDLLGIRFEPGGLHALLGAPMHELTDLDVCLGQANGELRRRLQDAAAWPALADRVAAVEAVLLAELDRRGRLSSGPGLVAEAVRLLERGPTTTGAVAERLGVSGRTLERAFRLEVGLPPRLYRRIRRLQGVLQRIEAGRPLRGWAETAVEHGYADQSHLIRDFRLLADSTPERYPTERTPLAGLMEQGDVSRSSNPGAVPHP